jgi:hypothetical protein
MGKRQLLFVTYRDENMEEGVSYAIELAKAMYEDITFLLVQKQSNLLDRLGTLMTAVTFAEADEHDTARSILSGESPEQQAAWDLKLGKLRERCNREGISVKVSQTDQGTVSGIRSFLRDNTGIDKVVLSPAMTESGNVTSKDLNRLVRTASRPIVTMTRQAVAVA